MSKSTLTTIEINGVKMEVDLRYAKRIDTLTVGSKVKVLIKSDYASSPSDVHSGVVIGFEPFKDLPTIVVCYLVVSYSTSELKFAYINETTAKKYDIIASVDDDLPIKKADVLSQLDKEIDRRRNEIDELHRKRHYFLKNFNTYFTTENAE
ncbi:hypothetical protein KC887_02105 [Candidatus Kaiserbacteria bacterium]|nr:hypothetical protein [Candidatus Kaiserbacteria bacterium]